MNLTFHGKLAFNSTIGSVVKIIRLCDIDLLSVVRDLRSDANDIVKVSRYNIAAKY